MSKEDKFGQREIKGDEPFMLDGLQYELPKEPIDIDCRNPSHKDIFTLISEVRTNENWTQRTYAKKVPGGCIVRTTTRQQNRDGTYSLSEALVFVPKIQIKDLY